MALQNKLKAFVRFDGSGRVIPSSLILQKSKPKVGDWKEINATQCCNDTPTTTTTTTSGGGGTAWTAYFGYNNPLEACNEVNGSVTLYTAENTIQNGTAIYADPALTVNAKLVYSSYNYYKFGGQNIVYQVGDYSITVVTDGVLCTSLTTTTTTTTEPSIQQYRISSTGCQGCPDGCSQDLDSGSYVYAEGPAYATPRTLYANLELTIPFTGNQGLYKMMQGYPSGQAYSVYVTDGQMTSVTSTCS
jgi:hypothetical protein